MAYNVKLSGEEIEHIAVVLHKFGMTNTCARLAQTFSTIMCNSPRLREQYARDLLRGLVSPAKGDK